MSTIPTPDYSEQSPLLLGDDDGSPARLVLSQAYWGTPGRTWTKGDVAWVAGSEVDWAIGRRLICPVAQPDPVPAAGQRAPRRTVAAALPPLAPDPEPAYEGSVSAIQAAPEPEPDGATYDLDAVTEPESTPTPTPTPRPRPRRSGAA